MADRRQLYRYKGDRCVHCGLTVQEMIDRYGTFHRMFQLNHVDPGKKDKEYDNLIRREISTEQLDEVDKCVLLCNECHGVVHAQNITATVKVTVEVKRRKTEQTLTGQLILDRLDRRATFLTDQRILVNPYWVYVGSRRPKMMFGTELEGGYIDSQLRQIHEIKKLAIQSWDKTFMMRATPDEDGVEIEHSVRFPLFTSVLCGDDGETVALWVRNGVVLTRGGEVIKDGVVTYHGVMTEAKGSPAGR